MERPPADRHDTIIRWAFAKLDVIAFVAASAAVAAVALFALTMILVVKGAPPGVPVGPHLAQLGAFFPGYAVTAAGAWIGAAYAGAAGGAFGLVLASVWNFAHTLLLAILRMRAGLASYSMD